MSKLKLLNIGILIATIFLVSFPVTLSAQSTAGLNGFSVSPPSFNVNAKAGDVILNTIKIENISNNTINIAAKTQSFVAYGNEGQILLTDEESVYSINSWLTFDTPNISISPGQTALFNFTLKVPENAQPGSHFGSIVFNTSTDQVDLNGAKIVQEVGTILLVRLPGDVTEAAEVGSFQSNKGQYTDPKVKLDTLIKNTGSVIVTPSGKITISDILGNQVQVIDVAARNILPGNERVFDQEFDFDKVGFFTAKLDLTYGDSQTLTASTSFAAFYLQRTVPIIVGIFVLLILYILLRKRINRAFRVIIKGE